MIPREILKKVHQIEIRTRHIVNDVFAGQYHSAFKGQGIEFHEVRPYIPGDEIRSIDWNVTARTGEPHVKKFVEERQLTIMLAVDVSASQQFGSTKQFKKDLAAELAAVLSFAAIHNNDRVGLLLFSDQVELFVPPAKGVRHVLRVIREVLYFKPKGTGSALEPALDYLNRVTRHKAIVFLISDFLFSEAIKRPLALTARRHDLVNIITGDQREQQWPRAGLVEWEDAETGQRCLVDTSSKRVRRELAIQQLAAREQLLSQIRRCGGDALEVWAGEEYSRELARFFRMRERRRR